MQSPLKYPCLPAVPAYSTPLRMPCSCKNANKACVDYDLIHLVAYFEHVQQQRFTLIFLWVGLCDLPADERMPVFPQHSGASAFPDNHVNLSESNGIVYSYVACALRHTFKNHLGYTNTHIFYIKKQKPRPLLFVLREQLSVWSRAVGAHCKINCSWKCPWKISSGSTLHSVTQHFIWTVQH